MDKRDLTKLKFETEPDVIYQLRDEVLLGIVQELSGKLEELRNLSTISGVLGLSGQLQELSGKVTAYHADVSAPAPSLTSINTELKASTRKRKKTETETNEETK